MQKTLRIKNDIHELSMMNQFLEEAGEELGLSTAFMMSLNLVMEEAVSNIIFYAYKGDVEDAVGQGRWGIDRDFDRSWDCFRSDFKKRP